LRVARFLPTMAAYGMLCACSNGSISNVAPLASTATQAAKAATAHGSLLVISDALRQEIRIYDLSSRTLWGKIPLVLLPGGLAIDASKDLYVASLSGITAYPPPYDRPSEQLSMSGQPALAVAVAPNGMVTGISGQNIFVYPAGSQQPCFEYSPANYARLTSVAFDSKNNIFFTGYDTSGNISISEMPGQCGNVTSTQLTIGNTLRSASSIAIGPDGRVSVLDTSAKAIFTYDAPVGNSLGSPVTSTLLERNQVRNPVAFVFDPHGKSVYTADSASGRVDEFAFPAGGSPTDTLTVGGEPVGVDIVPPYLPKAE
jgi:DNA-binding beta-propeller fold protein YncE